MPGRYISAANRAARKKSSTDSRDFLWISARNRSTGLRESVGFCSDEASLVAQVREPATNNPVTRAFYGAGGLISISEIVATLSITVQTVTITMSQIDSLVAQAFRLYDAKLAPVEIYIGMLDLHTKQLVDPAECRFYGFINDIEVTEPEEGSEGQVVITATSHTQEMIRSNPETRSHESQQIWHPGDDFYKDCATVGTWVHFWGKINGKVSTSQPASPANQSATGGSTGRDRVTDGAPGRN